MLPNINLDHLKYFHDAVLLGGITSAARQNFVSQSAISQGILKLEQALQATLTTHQRQNFNLTEQGFIVFEESKKIFGSVDALKERLQSLNGEISGNATFGCTNAIAQFFLPSIYLKSRKQYPLVQIKFHRGGTQFIHEALRQEKVSFAIVLDTPEFEDYDKTILFKGAFRLYQAKTTKSKSKKTHEIPGILIDHFENAEVRTLRKMYREHYKKELEIKEALSGWALVATFVQMGCGIGFLPDFIFPKNNKDVGEIILDIPKIEYSICAIKPKGTLLNRASQAFLELCS